MKNTVLALVVIVASLTCPTNSTAKERRGAELAIHKLDGQQLKGELIAVKPASLLLLDSQSGVDMSVLAKDVDVIKIIKKPKTLAGAVIGFIAGAGAGALVGLVVDEAIGQKDLVWGPQHSALLGGSIGGVVGGVVGGAIGANAGHPETLRIAGKSDTEIKELLEKLRRQARVTNAQ